MNPKKIIIGLLFLLVLSACKPQEYEIKLFEGQDTVEINSEWEDMGAGLDLSTYWAFSDRRDGDVDTTTLGTYILTYHVNYRNESYQVSRVVIVVDQTAPEITLHPGIDSIEVGDTWEDAGAIVTDNSLEELDVTVEGAVDNMTAGTYEITYHAEDSSGNQSVVTRYVTVFEGN